MKKMQLILGMMLALMLAATAVNADMYQINFNDTVPSYIPHDKMVVQVLKYNPYPVNPGEWFDMWIQVQNVNQDDAPHVEFELMPEYPFSSTDTLVRDYGVISGSINAYKVGQPVDASQVILRYRVKVADNAPEGTSELKLKITPNKNDPTSKATIQDIPIVIGKTKTDFDVVMQDSNAQGTSFAIANIGDNTATAVTFTIEPQTDVSISGPHSSIIGNLAKGDFTTVTFQITPNSNLHEMKLKLAYTDIAGVRNEIEKTVPVAVRSAGLGLAGAKAGTRSTGLLSYYPLALSFVVGIGASLIYRKFKKKKS